MFENDNRSRIITITLKLYTVVPGTKVSDKFDDDLSVIFITYRIRSWSTLLVNVINGQRLSQSL